MALDACLHTLFSALPLVGVGQALFDLEKEPRAALRLVQDLL